MGKGKRFELDTKNDINANTKPWVKAHRPDFSGSSTGEVADIMVVWQANRYGDQRPCGHPERHVAYGELKKRSGKEGNRSTVMSGSSEKPNGEKQRGLEELQELNRESPPWSKKVVGFKFPRREMVVIDAEVLEHWLKREQEGWGQDVLAHGADSSASSPPEQASGVEDSEFNHFDDDYQKCERHGLRLTPKNNISMVMPEKADWPTQSSGLDPWEKFCREVGLEPYDFDTEDN
jgi:hypothetical protein